MPTINYLAILACGVASIIVGTIWYGPLFGKMWMAGMGFDKLTPEQQAEGKKKMGLSYFLQFVCALIAAFVLAHVLWAFSIAMPTSSFMAGLQGGIWVWLGFVFTVKYGESLWTGKAFKYTAVELGYWLVMLVIMGLILSYWK